MQEDLKKIKKKYGENMMHLCRELFPTILETEGLLYKILISKFDPSKFLYDDIINEHVEAEFKSLIFHELNTASYKVNTTMTPAQLLKKAGYELYECKTEEDIQSFKKYYAENEELCTFRGGRLERCHVFFAVKENVDEIKREDFPDPKRQDEYGTSVISIQFTRGLSNTLSIKNRYNHTVINPDATFNNNLDNIIEGLNNSFSDTYGFNLNYPQTNFELPNYVMAKDKKYYKYNYEFDNRYYCPGNIIIDNFEIDEKYRNERYIVFDYFILDLKEKKICQYHKVKLTSEEEDSFIDEFESFDRVDVIKLEDGKRKITIQNEGKEDIIIIIDRFNRMIEYTNNNMKKVRTGLLSRCEYIQRFEANKLENLSTFTLKCAVVLKELITPNVEYIEDDVLVYNNCIKKLILPNVKEIGKSFLFNDEIIEEIDTPNVKKTGCFFLYGIDPYNLKKINFPNGVNIDNTYLCNYFEKNGIYCTNDRTTINNIYKKFGPHRHYTKKTNINQTTGGRRR